MARTTKEEALNTKNRLLNTAIDRFYEKGVSETSLEDIAESAGLTRGAIYWHFENKLALINEIHNRFHLSILDMLTLRLNDASQSPLERLRTVNIDFLNSLNADPARRAVLSIFLYKCDYSGDMADFLLKQYERKRESLALSAKCFREAIVSGEIHAASNAEVLAYALQCYILGLTGEALRNPERTDMNATRLVDIFFAGLTMPPSD